MAKKKTALSSLDKAFAIAGRFPSMVPGEFREELVRFRSRHKDKAAFLGLKESPAEKVTVTPENRDFLERVQKKENDMEYVAVMRDLTLGFWYNQKVVYQFLPETLEYIKNVFKPEQIQVNLNAVIRRMCSKPIYIGLPNGSDIQGFFCSFKYFQQRSAPTLSPSLEAHTSTPTSAARTPDCISPTKSKLPGVSSTLIFTP